MEYHQPVMLSECIEGLAIKSEGIYVDATFGGGGHSRAILEQLDENGRLLAFDRDEDATACAPADPRFTLINENFAYLKNFLRMHGVRRVDGLLADLGVSSHQFDVPERGFSIRSEGALDLRMDRRQPSTAADLVNTADEGELRKILWLYGELPNASAMAHAICTARSTTPITSTKQLCDTVAKLLPRGKENKYLAMLFQALRIDVNGELDALRALLQQAVELLVPDGRLVIISYHSLEDRLVKNMMRTGNLEGELHKDFYGNPITTLVPVERKAITPSAEELQRNNRARSAKLRIARRTTIGTPTERNLA